VVPTVLVRDKLRPMFSSQRCPGIFLFMAYIYCVFIINWQRVCQLQIAWYFFGPVFSEMVLRFRVKGEGLIFLF